MITDKFNESAYKRRKCEWIQTVEGVWDTECGQMFFLNFDVTRDFNYCPYCGHEIKTPSKEGVRRKT